MSDLRIFRTVALTGGITSAAARLYRVPSSVTTRVRQLEAKLGKPLFLRERRRLTLSPQGRVFLDYCERILALAEAARGAVNDPINSGSLRVGALESTAASLVPRHLAEYHRRYPGVSLEFRTGPTAELERLVLDGTLDAAIAAAPRPDARLARRKLYVDELVIATDRSVRRVASVGELAGRTALAFRAGCAYRAVLERWYESEGAAPARTVEFTSYYAILSCVVAGMGVAVMPRRVLDAFPHRLRLRAHPLPPRLRVVPVELIWKASGLDEKIAAFLRVLRPTDR